MSLLASGSATVAGGEATVTLGPVPPGRRWNIDTLTVSLSTGSGTARVYDGPAPSDDRLVEGTYSGDQDTTDRLGVLHVGEAVTVKWTDATNGATARVLLRGRELAD